MPGACELYLIRHAVAEERSDAWPDDDQRPLTGHGATRMRQAARGLVRLGVTFDVVLASPLVRARQTAEIVAGAFDSRPLLVTVESLQPGGSFQALFNDLAPYSPRTRIALVGHEPGLGELASRLLGSRQPLQFKKGAVCRIDVEALPPAGPGVLRWFLTTKILRQVTK